MAMGGMGDVCDGCGRDVPRDRPRPVPELRREQRTSAGCWASKGSEYEGTYCAHECFWLSVVTKGSSPDLRMMALTRLVHAAARELERERLQRTWLGRLLLWWRGRSHDEVLDRW